MSLQMPADDDARRMLGDLLRVIRADYSSPRPVAGKTEWIHPALCMVEGIIRETLQERGLPKRMVATVDRVVARMLVQIVEAALDVEATDETFVIALEAPDHLGQPIPAASRN